MAQGIEATILAALLDHLGTLTFSPALPVAYPGVTFPKAGQQKPDNYLQVSFLPNRTATLSVSKGRQMHQGILQISVFWKAGEGHVKPLDAADRIIQHFTKGTRLISGAVKIKIDNKPWVSGPLQETDRVQFPVTIPYRSFNA